MLAVWKVADGIELFESGWTFDHFYPIFSDSTGPCMEGWITLTALAQATTRLRMGTLVTGIHYRHPAILANMTTTLDIVSGGRLELGIGAGWNEEESGAYGIELGRPGQRSDRFEEACEVIVGLLTQETTTFKGQYYQLSDARNEPKPVQHPHPPICIGGSGERRTLRTAARFAQHWNFVGGTPEEFARKRGILHQHCEDLGRDPGRYSSPVTSESPGRRRPPPSRPPHWQRSAPSWASSISHHPWIPVYSSRWPPPCVSSKEAATTPHPDRARVTPSRAVGVDARREQTPCSAADHLSRARTEETGPQSGWSRTSPYRACGRRVDTVDGRT